MKPLYPGADPQVTGPESFLRSRRRDPRDRFLKWLAIATAVFVGVTAATFFEWWLIGAVLEHAADELQRPGRLPQLTR